MCSGAGQGGHIISGKLITFEGIDASGKTTQIQLLKTALETAGHAIIVVREPGGTHMSERIRKLLLDARADDLSDSAEALLFSAARSQLVAEVIQPALKAGKTVICDRYSDSTIAYQAYGRELPFDQIVATQLLATGGLAPDLTILLDIAVETWQLRIGNDKVDRMESAGADFMRRVRDGYLALAGREPARWLRADGSGNIAQIHELIFSRVKKLMEVKS